MEEILSKRELIALTGYRSNKAIAKWLRKNRITYKLGGDDIPKVHRQAVAYAFGVPTDKPHSEIELDFNQKGFKL